MNDVAPVEASGRRAEPAAVAGRIRASLAAPIRDDRRIDPTGILAGVLAGVGLTTDAGGGKVTFVGRDPIIASPLPLATMAAVGLAAKSVAVADLWRARGGRGQDITVDVRRALHRLCPFYDRKWELLNGHPPGQPSDPTNPFMPGGMFRTRDGRMIQLVNFYPRLKTSALAFLGCNDHPEAIGAVVRRWDAFELERRMVALGLQATVIRTPEEFMAEEQFAHVAGLPLVEIRKIGDSPPEAMPPDPTAPLDGVRALGLGHVIAGAGLGRALAYHGADVLNLWRPIDFELDQIYYCSNVGMRSSTVELARPDGTDTFRRLLAGADVFFANRRPGYLDRYGLTPSELAGLRPGLIHVTLSAYGQRGPWADRIGFDQNAGGATGVLTLEGTADRPRLPEIFVVNDFVMAWLAAMGTVAALKRRASEGGSYEIHVCLARLSLWLLELGLFDKAYARGIAGSGPDHAYLPPETFEAQTPCGHYQGVTDQVAMTETPGHYRVPLVPRGSSRASWLTR